MSRTPPTMKSSDAYALVSVDIIDSEVERGAALYKRVNQAAVLTKHAQCNFAPIGDLLCRVGTDFIHGQKTRCRAGLDHQHAIELVAGGADKSRNPQHVRNVPHRI